MSKAEQKTKALDYLRSMKFMQRKEEQKRKQALEQQSNNAGNPFMMSATTEDRTEEGGKRTTKSAKGPIILFDSSNTIPHPTMQRKRFQIEAKRFDEIGSAGSGFASTILLDQDDGTNLNDPSNTSGFFQQQDDSENNAMGGSNLTAGEKFKRDYVLKQKEQSGRYIVPESVRAPPMPRKTHEEKRKGGEGKDKQKRKRRETFHSDESDGEVDVPAEVKPYRQL